MPKYLFIQNHILVLPSYATLFFMRCYNITPNALRKKYNKNNGAANGALMKCSANAERHILKTRVGIIQLLFLY